MELRSLQLLSGEFLFSLESSVLPWVDFPLPTKKKDVDLGPVQLSHEQKKTVPIPPILSTIVLIGGIGLVVVGVRGK